MLGIQPVFVNGTPPLSSHVFPQMPLRPPLAQVLRTKALLPRPCPFIEKLEERSHRDGPALGRDAQERFNHQINQCHLPQAWPPCQVPGAEQITFSNRKPEFIVGFLAT